MELKDGQENGAGQDGSAAAGSDRIVVVRMPEDTVGEQPHRRLTREEIAELSLQPDLRNLKDDQNGAVTKLKDYAGEIRPRFDDDPGSPPPVEAPPDLETDNFALHRKVSELEAQVKKQASAIKRKDHELDNAGTRIYRGIKFNEWGTRSSMYRLVSRIFGARDYHGSEG